jgi:hypothetical protein
MNDPPEDFLRISCAVNWLSNGMWGCLQRTVPVAAIKQDPKKLSLGFGPWRENEIFTLPIEAARCKAREIIYQSPQSGFIPIIENWRQRPDGQIEFAIRHLRAGD